MKPKNNTEDNLYSKIEELLSVARQKVLQTVNQTMVYTYYEIGKIIIEHEQGGKERAKYGKSLLKNISQKLSGNFGKGFSVDNLENMRKFYLAYSKSETTSRKFNLSYSHYLKLMRIEDIGERNFYEIEAFQNGWSKNTNCSTTQRSSFVVLV